MNRGASISKILFDYDTMTNDKIIEIVKDFPKKILRWLGENHPDNRTRKIFFEMTGIRIGEGTVINKYFVISDDYEQLLVIGERVAISPNVTIICASGPNNSLLNQNDYVKNHLIVKKTVDIGNDVWIGANVVILPGVIIGANSVIGAGSILSKNVEPFSIVAGSPARIIRNIR